MNKALPHGAVDLASLHDMKHRLGDERANGERNVEANDLSRWRRSRRKKELKRS